MPSGRCARSSSPGVAVQRDRPAGGVAAVGVELVDDARARSRRRASRGRGVDVVSARRVAAGQPRLGPAAARPGPRTPGTGVSVGRPSRSAIAAASALRRRRSSRRPAASGSASSAGSRHSGLAVGAPVHADQPARERLARIPLALAVLDQRAGREVGREPVASGRSRGARLVGPSAAMFHSGVFGLAA